MESNYKAFNFEKSRERLDDILNSTSSFEEKDTIPSRDQLTYTNGYYVNCSSLFIDLRDSSKLPERHQSKVLAKIYRSYISEAVAIINGEINCKEINIVGDCVSAIFESQYKYQIDGVFSTIARLKSLIDVLNYKLEKKGYSTIKAGIGASYGRVLMIKAGYSGSTINDVVYMGEAVNKASKMCSKASKEISSPIVVTSVFFNNLNADNQKMLTHKYLDDLYHGSVVNIEMNNWLDEQRKKDEE
ncbi:adenylate/guanylate cyclase domain-containing protein [Paenibacillus sp. SZ31]|nr:adenylate/guanylate cyclase domain-containing protein [Paenibacillus sp. SZ31]NMI05037.1 adenylate/guanylate cyclase domain-containing protein [Paenibacillus sp. SZ31]